ncbi:pleckstrin homology-like domain family B member 1 isoform X2 [Equus quagga]|uniref:pleckstrin homology-like domain family B member 1 isoform X2 n=1 Tax=Equus quagga TaxID=89248 RepID=UPI001EE15B59|nr:pleckstrin homology-like domain family B member 1 isoform X2 [Equus quagga]
MHSPHTRASLTHSAPLPAAAPRGAGGGCGAALPRPRKQAARSAGAAEERPLVRLGGGRGGPHCGLVPPGGRAGRWGQTGAPRRKARCLPRGALSSTPLHPQVKVPPQRRSCRSAGRRLLSERLPSPHFCSPPCPQSPSCPSTPPSPLHCPRDLLRLPLSVTPLPEDPLSCLPISFFVPQALYYSVPLSPPALRPRTFYPVSPPSSRLSPPQLSFFLIPQSPSLVFASTSLRLPLPARSPRGPLVFSSSVLSAPAHPHPAPATRPLGSQPQFPSLPDSFLCGPPFLEGGCAPGRRRRRRAERTAARPRRPRATAMRRPGRGLGWPPGPQELWSPRTMDTLNRSQVGPGFKTQAMVQKGPLDLIETGKGLKVQTDKPHLVSLGSGRLSTAITLLPLEEGRTVIGSAARDISLQGPGLAPEHCYIENLRGTLTLYPCGNACTIDGLPVQQPTRLTQGCMLCLGQSTFLRFNHPAEAKWMKSMIPAGGRAPGPPYSPGPESESLVNGNHTPQPATRGPSACASHSSLVSSIEKDLQEIMDSLVLEDPGAAGKKPAATSPLSPMANGGRYLLSPPVSPGAMSVGSSYENTSPAFSPLSSPASSGSCASHSPSGQEPAPSLPPLVPARSSSYHLALQPPQSRPSGARSSESPRLGRKGGHERPPSPGLRGLLTDSPAATVLAEARRATESPRLGGQLPVVAISLSEYPASGARTQHTSIPGSPKFQPPVPAPRNKIGTLQDRPPSPFREPPGTERALTTSPSRQLVGRTFSDGSATRTLQPPESPRLGRRGLDSMRELPPLSPSLSRRALSPIPARTTPDLKLTREVAESPRPRRWAAHGASQEDFSLTLGARSRRTRSPSPTLGESLAPRKGSFSGRLSPAYSLGSLTGASPRQSPRSQRKLSSGDLRVPVTRERKNSITEISDNEDDLLEYHRRQRQERLREQEMERLERQRLETILNLCAEYSRADGGPEAGELPSIGEATAALALAGRRPSRGLAGAIGASGRSNEEPGSATQRLWESVERSDEENLKEECSSTESTQQEHEDAPSTKLQGEVLALEEERAQVLGRVEQLKVRVKELEQQLQESAREAEMERALLQGEREAERALLQKEQKAVDQLQEKLVTLETGIQKERDKERAELAAGRRHLEARQALYAELQTQLDNCPESVREQLQEQLRREAEALETETKLFEDLEFQQLERESRVEEERELAGQGLLRSKAELLRSITKRKERLAVLDSQAGQIRAQAVQESERLARDKNASLQLLQKEKEKLTMLERRYHSLTGGRPFPKTSSTLKEAELLISESSEVGLGTVALGVFPGSSQAGASSVPLTPPASTQLCPKAQEEYVSLAEVLQLCSRLDPYASATSPSVLAQPLPDSEYVTLEQLKAMWGTLPMPTAPAPGLPLWASASWDLVPTTCLPPVLPSSSSFASITPSPKMEKLLLPAVDLEQWYQELMAGLGTGPTAASPRSSPPPLPAKASRQLQVYRSKTDGEATSPLPRTRSGPLPSSSGSSSSSSQLSVATLGRSPSPKSAQLSQNGTGSLPRNLAATLQDIETKRQLALQQKVELLPAEPFPTDDPAGQQVIEEQRRRLAELKQKAAAEAQCQWDALHGAAPFPAGPSGFPPLMHHSILHHLPAGRERGEEGEHAYDTLSLESSDSMETSISTGGNSACSPDNVSSASGLDMGKIEEMEKMLKEAHAEKSRLIESREREIELRRQALEEERRRREQVERRLQSESAKRQQLVEKEVKMREKQFSQARPLTRYLPIRKEDFDLKTHIESSGHGVDTCLHVVLSSKVCRGYLVKMGGKIKSWKKRWFVFDRLKRTLSYYVGEFPQDCPRAGTPGLCHPGQLVFWNEVKLPSGAPGALTGSFPPLSENVQCA